jgi:hypothetical protein
MISGDQFKSVLTLGNWPAIWFDRTNLGMKYNLVRKLPNGLILERHSECIVPNIVLVANVPTIISVSPKLPVANLQDVVAYGKRHARELSIGNPGYGTGGHIAAVQFAGETGIEVTHVPYRGVAPMLTDVMSGQIGLGFGGFVPQVLNMKAVAVTASALAAALRRLTRSSKSRRVVDAGTR